MEWWSGGVGECAEARAFGVFPFLGWGVSSLNSIRGEHLLTLLSKPFWMNIKPILNIWVVSVSVKLRKHSHFSKSINTEPANDWLPPHVDRIHSTDTLPSFNLRNWKYFFHPKFNQLNWLNTILRTNYKKDTNSSIVRLKKIFPIFIIRFRREETKKIKKWKLYYLTSTDIIIKDGIPNFAKK